MIGGYFKCAMAQFSQQIPDTRTNFSRIFFARFSSNSTHSAHQPESARSLIENSVDGIRLPLGDCSERPNINFSICCSFASHNSTADDNFIARSRCLSKRWTLEIIAKLSKELLSLLCVALATGVSEPLVMSINLPLLYEFYVPNLQFRV